MKPYIVYCESAGDANSYCEITRHSSRKSAERKAAKHERETGLSTWVHGPDDGEE